jgi:hypothetical protein
MILLPLLRYYCTPNAEKDNKLNITDNTNTCSEGLNVLIITLLIIFSIYSAWLGAKLWYSAPTDFIKVGDVNSESSKPLVSGFFGLIIGAFFGPIYLVYYYIFYTWLRIGCKPKFSTDTGDCKFWPLCGERENGICSANVIDSIFGLY